MPDALRLEVDADHLATLTFDLPDRRANIFTRAVLAELEQLVAELTRREDIACLVLVSAKPGMFVAGADVEEIERVADAAAAAEGARYGQRLFAAWEALPFPTVAAVQGTCVGGGTELALASSYIVLSDRPDLRIGLPEIKLGILPGWGGCVRLPRRVGLLAALDIILAGKTIPSRQAERIGLADAVFPEPGFLHHVRRFALERAGRRSALRRPRGLRRWLVEANPAGRWFVFDQARKKTLARTRGRYPAPLAALEVVRTGLEQGAERGFAAEAEAIGQLAPSPTAKHLVHLFRLLEASKRDGNGVLPGAVSRPAVIGAGVMGGGVAYSIVERTGLPVRLKDIQLGALGTALAHAATRFDEQVRRRRMTPAEKRRRMARIQPTLNEASLAAADLVIEAVVEDLEVKQRVFADLAARVAPTALLASNTSALSIDAIAERTPHPERVVGMHFFNPVERMQLVEVIAGARTSRDAVGAAAAFVRRLGKTPIVVRDGPGFLVNRLLAFYSAEAMWLLDEGYRVEDVDRAMLEWGMPMGPLRLADEVGLDVSSRVGRILHAAFPERLVLPDWIERLAGDAARLGVKSGRGIYRYAAGREAGADPALYAILGLRPERRNPDLAALAERMVLPMVNEAARCLGERLVEGPGPLDLALVLGIGFPPFRGGLCRWADERGLPSIVERLRHAAVTAGPRMAPSEELIRQAARGTFY